MVHPFTRLPIRLLAIVVFCCLGALGCGQTPRLYLKFDGNLTDSSGTGIITAVTPNAGWVPTYGPDRFGVANKALIFAGSQSLQLGAGALPGNSNQALGLRNASGTNTSFTLSAWVKLNSTLTWYNCLFGNLGSGAGTLNAGTYINSGKTIFAFDGTGGIGNIDSVVAGAWYHMAFVYDAATGTQRVYINGVPEFSRTVSNSLKVADLYLGNWSTATANDNDLQGSLDEVAVFNAALSGAQVQALYNGADASSVPATFTAPKLPGVLGAAGVWGVREIKAYPGATFPYGTLVRADRILNAYATAPLGTVAQYISSVINFTDPNAPGNLGAFANEANFGTNTPGPDTNFLLLAKATVRIAIEDDYTFGFIGDDGSRLRIVGQTFTSTSSVNGAAANPVSPANVGDALYWANTTTNSGTIGVVHLPAGDYPLELTYWQGSGTSSIEVFAARGAKTALDTTFQLVGNTAAGGLPLVSDPDTVATLTANGGTQLFVNGGVPANFTLAWSVANPTTTLSIDHGIGAVSQNGSTVLASPAATTTYTITATTTTLAGVQTTTKSVTVYVDAPPTVSITATNSTVLTGASTTLNWVVGYATTLTLNPGNIDVTGQTSRVVTPAATTTYTLTATNANGSTSQSILINVGDAPTINSFIVADPTPLYGAETSLQWNVSNANTLSIDQNVGPVTGAIGAASIAPLLSTTYKITAVNDYGTSTATASVNQPTPIGVSAAGFTARRVFAQAATPIPFAGQGYLQSALSLIGTGPNTGQNELNEATQTNYSTVNFSDGVDGDFPNGNSNFPGSGVNNYAVQITGTLVVNSPGAYTFVVNSSWGCRLRIDGQDVIFNDASQSPGDSTATVTLSKPTVAIEVISYGVSGSSEVELGWIRPNLVWTLLDKITPATPVVHGQLLISEFMASNGNTISDEDGASSDWLEIWNSSNATVNLGTYFLTNKATTLNKWALPAWTLGPNQYAVIFASSKNRTPAQAVAGQDNLGTLAQPHLHTNFSLTKTGGYLALTQSNGAGGYNVISSFNPYPLQSSDVSYGSSDDESFIGYMDVPTPGSPNAATVQGFVANTTFSQPRGRYSAPFNLTLGTPTPGCTIRYTTDGSLPSLSHGTVYTGPLSVAGTAALRAAAYKPGWKPSAVNTQTYLFIDDVVTQTSANAVSLGFPSGPINGQVFRYGMNLGNVIAGGGTLADLKSALTSAPTICMTTDVANLANPTTGIYVNPGQHDLFWERPVSIEYLNTAGTSEFQINAGARIRGGFSRSTTNPKHAFHLYFRSNFYDGKLTYKLFGNSGASTFSQIDMRSEENYSWGFGLDPQNSLMREEWGRATVFDMGEPGSHNGYFHVYINGLYWGIYNWEERTESDFGASYLGGNKDTTDVLKSSGASGNPSYGTETTDGNFGSWQTFNTLCIALKNDVGLESSRTAKYMQMRGLNPDGTPNAAYPVLLDVDNLIDYLLDIYYDGSYDAPVSTFLSNASNNWFGIRDRTGTRGFAFFIHDNEHGLDTGVQSYNRVGPWGGTGNNNWGQGEYGTRETFNRSNPQYLHELLAYSAEYRLRFADRVQKHCFNGGALTTNAALIRLNALAALVDPMIHAEAARWGSNALNRTSWLGAKATIINCINNGGASQAGQTVFGTQSRASLIIAELQGYQDPVGSAKPLASTFLAPTFSGQFGGSVSSPYTFNIANPNGPTNSPTGTIYYSVNGADPRNIGGGINAGALTGASPIPVTITGTSNVQARVYNSATQVWSALTQTQYYQGNLATSSNLAISKIHYHPAGVGNLTQFVELMNIGASSIDLSGVHFTQSIQFTFPTAYPLMAPGARLLIVRDMNAFTTAYPTVPAGQIAGIFANNTTLSAAGARLQLLDVTNAIIRDFTYADKDPWPESPDGSGPALVLLRPTTNPDHSIGANWRASYAVGGSPGVDDALLYTAWATANGITDPTATADADHDGLTDLVEYGLGANPNVASLSELPAQGSQTVDVGGIVSNYLTLTYSRAIGRDDVSYAVEATTDLLTWVPAVNVGAPTFNNNGYETLTYRHPTPKAGQPRQFLRLRFTKLP